jgi:hypothetical protein
LNIAYKTDQRASVFLKTIIPNYLFKEIHHAYTIQARRRCTAPVIARLASRFPHPKPYTNASQ